MLTLAKILELYQFEELPIEGGLFKQTYRTDENIKQVALPARYKGDKAFGTAILYLFTPEANSFSALHCLPTDEIWHFYMGDPVEMLQLYPDGQSAKIILGQDILNGQRIQYVAPRGVWQGSYMLEGGSFALVGTTMSPGYSDTDYVGGERDTLIQQYPHEAALITRLTRVGNKVL